MRRDTLARASATRESSSAAKPHKPREANAVDRLPDAVAGSPLIQDTGLRRGQDPYRDLDRIEADQKSCYRPANCCTNCVKMPADSDFKRKLPDGVMLFGT